MDEAKAIVEDFFGKLEEVDKTLEELQNRAKVLEDQQDRCDDAQSRMEALRDDIGKLQQERRELMRFWGEADFEGDVQRQAQITKRRKAIDRSIGEKEKEIQGLVSVVEENQPDAKEVAELSVALDLLQTPNPYDFAEGLKRALWPQHYELSGRVGDVQRMLPGVDAALYDSVRAERQDSYRPYKPAAKKRVKGYISSDDTSSFVERNGLVSTGVGDRVTAEVSDRPSLDD